MGLATIDPHSQKAGGQKEHSEIHKILKVGFYQPSFY